MTSSIGLQLIVIRLGLSVNWKSAILDRVASQGAFRIYLYLPPSAGVTGIHNHAQLFLLLFLVNAGD